MKNFILNHYFTISLSILFIFLGYTCSQLFYIFFILLIMFLPFDNKISKMSIFEKITSFNTVEFLLFYFLFTILFFLSSFGFFNNYFEYSNFDINIDISKQVTAISILFFYFLYNIFSCFFIISHIKKYKYNLLKNDLFIILSLIVIPFIKLSTDQQIFNIDKYSMRYINQDDLKLSQNLNCIRIVKTKVGLTCYKSVRHNLLLSTNEINKLSDNNLFKDPNFIILVQSNLLFENKIKLLLNYGLENQYSTDNIKNSLNELDNIINK